MLELDYSLFHLKEKKKNLGSSYTHKSNCKPNFGSRIYITHMLCHLVYTCYAVLSVPAMSSCQYRVKERVRERQEMVQPWSST